MLKQLKITEEMLNSEDRDEDIIRQLTVARNSICALRDNVFESKYRDDSGAIVQMTLKLMLVGSLGAINTAQKILEEGPFNQAVLEFLINVANEGIDQINDQLKRNTVLHIPGQKDVFSIERFQFDPMGDLPKEEVEQLKEASINLSIFLDDPGTMKTNCKPGDKKAISDKMVAGVMMGELKASLSILDELLISGEKLTETIAILEYFNNRIDNLNNFFRKYDVTLDK